MRGLLWPAPLADAAPAGLEHSVFFLGRIRTCIGDLANCTRQSGHSIRSLQLCSGTGKHFLRLALFGLFLRRKSFNSTSMDQMGRLAFPSELPGVNRNDLTAQRRHSLRSDDLSPKLVRDQIPPAEKMTGSRLPARCRCRGRDGHGHGSHQENSAVAPVGVARAVPRRTGASVTVDADRQLA
jgi:hypothetical protein